MYPILADAIDLPFVAVLGLAIVVPLLLFEVGVEGWILSRFWNLRFRDTARFACLANIYSLLAGIPTKIFNAWLYGKLLPYNDLAGYFAAYSYIAALGAVIYFIVTIFVEGLYAFKWVRRKNLGLSRRAIWQGVLVANVATYVVLSPLYYFATRPAQDIQTFTHDSHWAIQPSEKIIYINSTNGYLEAVQSDGSQRETLVPKVVRDYLVSSNLNFYLFRGKDGSLYSYIRNKSQCDLVWQTSERFVMNQIAFSPSETKIAFGSKATSMSDEILTLLDLSTHAKATISLKADPFEAKIVWSTNENSLYVLDGKLSQLIIWKTNNSVEFSLMSQTNSVFTLLETQPMPTFSKNSAFICFGRVSDGSWWGGENWGASYREDKQDNLKAWAEPGLGAQLRISRDKKLIIRLAVNPGLIHLAQLGFENPHFLHDGVECLFEGGEAIYLMNVSERKVGKIVNGHDFILLSPPYEKDLN